MSADTNKKGEIMPKPIINSEDCTACGSCVEACPNGVLEIEDTAVSVVNEDECVACEACIEECPMGAITKIEED